MKETICGSVAALAAASVVLTACSAGSSDTGPPADDGSASASSTGTIVLHGTVERGDEMPPGPTPYSTELIPPPAPPRPYKASVAEDLCSGNDLVDVKRHFYYPANSPIQRLLSEQLIIYGPARETLAVAKIDENVKQSPDDVSGGFTCTLHWSAPAVPMKATYRIAYDGTSTVLNGIDARQAITLKVR